MILDLLRRSLARYFRRPATSVSPEKAPNSIELTPTLFGFKPRLVYVDPPWVTTPAALDRVEEAAQRLYNAGDNRAFVSLGGVLMPTIESALEGKPEKLS
jgi:hypothetical protein